MQTWQNIIIKLGVVHKEVHDVDLPIHELIRKPVRNFDELSPQDQVNICFKFSGIHSTERYYFSFPT
jgi:hypothetical protein